MSAVLSFAIEVSGAGLPEVVTDRQAMIQFGNNIRTIIIQRTLRGTDANGKAFVGYSTKPINIDVNARPTPKGGKVSRTGRTVRYKNGYKGYKEESRLPGAAPRGGSSSVPTSEVDLTASGQLLRSIQVAQADDDSVIVQTGPGTADYAGPVNDKREFMGLAPSDYDLIEAAAVDIIADALARKGYR